MLEPSTLTLPLHSIAHGRAGDKGNRSNISVIAYAPEFYPIIKEQVTADRVAHLFRHRGTIRVTRYDLPNLEAINLVIDEALEGGVNRSLNLDGHGKALSFLVLSLSVEIPIALRKFAKGVEAEAK
ncbi:MAG TPA: hypothetical protein VLK23_10230 [Thermodesulfobacteriota bacterium]|nr:hypothetical protein [Thermodesulfobacteriota bacterium]